MQEKKNQNIYIYDFFFFSVLSYLNSLYVQEKKYSKKKNEEMRKNQPSILEVPIMYESNLYAGKL